MRSLQKPAETGPIVPTGEAGKEEILEGQLAPQTTPSAGSQLNDNPLVNAIGYYLARYEGFTEAQFTMRFILADAVLTGAAGTLYIVSTENSALYKRICTIAANCLIIFFAADNSLIYITDRIPDELAKYLSQTNKRWIYSKNGLIAASTFLAAFSEGLSAYQATQRSMFHLSLEATKSATLVLQTVGSLPVLAYSFITLDPDKLSPVAKIIDTLLFAPIFVPYLIYKNYFLSSNKIAVQQLKNAFVKTIEGLKIHYKKNGRVPTVKKELDNKDYTTALQFIIDALVNNLPELEKTSANGFLANLKKHFLDYSLQFIAEALGVVIANISNIAYICTNKKVIDNLHINETVSWILAVILQSPIIHLCNLSGGATLGIYELLRDLITKRKIEDPILAWKVLPPGVALITLGSLGLAYGSGATTANLLAANYPSDCLKKDLQQASFYGADFFNFVYLLKAGSAIIVGYLQHYGGKEKKNLLVLLDRLTHLQDFVSRQMSDEDFLKGVNQLDPVTRNVLFKGKLNPIEIDQLLKQAQAAPPSTSTPSSHDTERTPLLSKSAPVPSADTPFWRKPYNAIRDYYYGYGTRPTAPPPP